MMKQNLTIQLDKAIIHDAKLLAAKRSTSLSKLLAAEIHRLAIHESNYEQIRKSALARLDKGYSLGGAKVPSRDEIHSR